MGRFGSGQNVSVLKSTVFFSKNVDDSLCMTISAHVDFGEVGNLGRYLGVPLLHSRVSKAVYQYIIQRVRDKLSGWSAKCLSFAGRLVLAKSVLSSIPYYSMQSTHLPKGVYADIEKIIRGFI
ncbi:hypothetical protein like AT3G24255 [Hibiscus trionum]|uniref:Uncharacterized protein n=1 Tax=Hibiscus trionum TaxID=183268 RepID=A0A9W7J709_HIBTR|nr:hypothetical protein like AT3G24255 [Hibiscus trionum]